MSGIDATDATFAEVVLAAESTVIVDFWAEWCGPCRALTPILEQIADAHAESVSLVKMDVDTTPETAARYGITAVPTIAVFQNGELVQTLIGAQPRPQMEERLAAYLT